jgi:hypothetical protein
LATSLDYGANIINNDFSMILYGGRVSVRFPLGGAKDITETVTGSTKTTKTTIDPQNGFAAYPNLDLNNIRLDVAPQIWCFFTPKLDPMVVISHIYLINTFTMMFFPEELYTEEQAGLSNGYIRQDRNYIANNLFGYYNRQYSISSKLSLAWRVNVQLAFYHDTKGHTFAKDLGDNAETETKVSNESLWMTANLAPRLAFAYQLQPGTFIINGGVVINPPGGTTGFGWQLNRNTEINNGEETTTIKNTNTFTGINPLFNLGGVWNLSPFLLLEMGASINTAGTGSPLSDVSVAIVYKR